jgi:transposase
MSQSKRRVFSQEFKLSAVKRMLAGEPVRALSAELGVRPKHFYIWREQFRAGGVEGLRGPGRPRKLGVAASATPARVEKVLRRRPTAVLAAAHHRIAELERKIGRQQVELDFFRQALRQVRGARRPIDGSGVTASTRSFKR